MSTARLLIGDVFDRMAEIPDGSIDLVLTSPPFLALRSYLPADHPDKDKEIGSEPTPAEFLDTLLALSAEWRRVLAPHGSIAVELGDTYSGSGGGGGDYLPGGLRENQPGFGGSAARQREGNAAHWRQKNQNKAAWPLPKSLVGIPHLFHLSLAYGRNLLTGEPSPAGEWRVRNVVAWCRPNPPVGALGDKVRPATSYMTIATLSRTRYFDLDAIRTALTEPDREFSAKLDHNPTHGEPLDRPFGQNPNGAPPLDHWWHEDEFDQDAWLIPTQPYAGSHYATWPAALCTKPIRSMVPQRVCTTCGEPSRRIVDIEYERSAKGGSTGARRDLSEPEGRLDSTGQTGKPVMDRLATTTGWTDCGHGSFACSSCGVLVPSDYALRRPRAAARGEAAIGGEAVLGEPVEGSGQPTDHAGHMRDVRGGLPGQARSAVLHQELFGQAGAPGGPGQQDPAPCREPGPEGEPPRLRPGVGAGGDAGAAEERLHDGAPTGDAADGGTPPRAVGDRPSSQRGEVGQPALQPGDRDASEARGDGAVPPLPGDVPDQLDEGYVCPCGGRELRYVEDHWRTGVVLDPFAGSGTTLAVATGEGREAIGIDIDERNADLVRERVGMFLDVELPTTAVPA